MTKKFDKAKAETIQKWSRILEAVKVANYAELGRCGFCFQYGDCADCPLDIVGLCEGEVHCDVRNMLAKLSERVAEGISLLRELEENHHS